MILRAGEAKFRRFLLVALLICVIRVIRGQGTARDSRSVAGSVFQVFSCHLSALTSLCLRPSQLFMLNDALRNGPVMTKSPAKIIFRLQIQPKAR